LKEVVEVGVVEPWTLKEVLRLMEEDLVVVVVVMVEMVGP
jgi:hypothetical protein